MHIGILQCGQFPVADGFPEQTYGELYEDFLSDRGLTFSTWSVFEMDFPDSVGDAEGWLVSGSKHGAYENVPFIAPLEDFLRKAYAADVPIVGICFGHQVLAQALGGRVEKFSGGWALGRQDYAFSEESVALHAWHQDQVVELPEEAKTIGTNDFCAHAALSYKGRAFSVQGHPEFSDDHIKLLMKVRRTAINAERAEAIANTLGQPLSNSLLADRIARFFKEPAHV